MLQQTKQTVTFLPQLYPHPQPQNSQKKSSHYPCPFSKTTSSRHASQHSHPHKNLHIKKPKNSKSQISEIVNFLNEISEHLRRGVPLLPILDTVVFNGDGTIKYIVSFDMGKLQVVKVCPNLQNFILERKFQYDYEFQQAKYRRENFDYEKMRVNLENERDLKIFITNINFMHPPLNRVAIVKRKKKEEEEILSQREVHLIFSRLSRKINDFIQFEYLQVFPVMYGHEQSSFITKIQYKREVELGKKNFKIAQYYISSWYSRNDSVVGLQIKFIQSIKANKQQMILYYTYKLIIFYQIVSNKMVNQATLYFITNDDGENYYLKNIKNLKIINLFEIEIKKKQFPKKLLNPSLQLHFNLKQKMKLEFDHFKKKYQIIDKYFQQMESLRLKDIQISNAVFQNMGNQLPEKYKTQSFIKYLEKLYSIERSKRLKSKLSQDKIY